MHQCIKFILFWNDSLHVSDGLAVIIRSSRLYTGQQAFVRHCCLLAGGYLLASRFAESYSKIK